MRQKKQVNDGQVVNKRNVKKINHSIRIAHGELVKLFYGNALDLMTF